MEGQFPRGLQVYYSLLQDLRHEHTSTGLDLPQDFLSTPFGAGQSTKCIFSCHESLHPVLHHQLSDQPSTICTVDQTLQLPDPRLIHLIWNWGLLFFKQ